jgi:peptidoglycan/LPS O-acetylase OafA/YrhL
MPGPAFDRAPFRWLTVCGQASLCFYVVHYLVFLAIARGSPWLASLSGLARYGLIYGAGLLLLVPVTRAYRDLRKRYPESPLKYL